MEFRSSQNSMERKNPLSQKITLMTTLKNNADSNADKKNADISVDPCLIDTHAHLCDAQFDADRNDVLKRAKESGVTTIVEIAESPSGWEKAIKSSDESWVMCHDSKKNPTHDSRPTTSSLPSIYWSCGFHPHYAEESSNFDFDIMIKAASKSNCLAIGEIGLDYFKSRTSREKQIALFEKGLELAAELNKPVVIHCRQAQADTLRILRSFFGGMARGEVASGVIHCFSGDLHFAEGCLDLGFYLGVDGPVTYPSARELREVIKRVPLERLVLETDAPYLPPQNFRGKRNEPAFLPLIAEKVAELLEKSKEEISKLTTENAKKLFRIR